MKISCPKCQASGSIPDHEVPESGRFISCPRCQEGFTIKKPKAGGDVYLVDTCPACSFSTFGDENFSDCPKCGVSVKSFIERQREEQRLKHNQELLNRKMNVSVSDEVAAPVVENDLKPGAVIIENMNSVNVIGWAAIALAVIVLIFGLVGLFSYDCEKIKLTILEQRDEQVSGLFVFLNYGLLHWIQLLYGVILLLVASQFIKRIKRSLFLMDRLIWSTIILVSLVKIIYFINWIFSPVSHTIAGYTGEILEFIVVVALICVPLYILQKYLQENKIINAVNLD